MMLHKLEHKADHDPAKKAFLHKIYEEMITLGFFSFGLILLIDFKILKANNPNLQKFEFAHLWLFMFGIFLVMHNLVGFVVIHKNERKWIVADAEDFDKLLQDSRKYQPRQTCCRMVFGGSSVHARMEYQAMKHLFLSSQNTSTFDFRFAKYLQRATSILLMEHLENISVASWLILVAVGIAYIAIITAMRGPTTTYDLWFSFGFGWVLCLCSMILMMMSKLAKTNLIRKNFPPGHNEPHEYPSLMTVIKAEQEENHNQRKEKFAKRANQREVLSGVGIATTGDPLKEEALFPCKLKTTNVLWLNDMITLLQCFFLGLFCTLIINEALNDLGTQLGTLYILAVVLEQGVVMLWFSPSTVKDVVLMQSTLHKENDIYDEVIDETQELLHLRKMIKRKIIEKWPQSEETKSSKSIDEYLTEIFSEIDTDGSGLLASKELKELFKKLNFNLHKRQCDLIIEEMDQDLSGEVDFSEFLEYMNVHDMEGQEKKLTITSDEGTPQYGH